MNTYRPSLLGIANTPIVVVALLVFCSCSSETDISKTANSATSEPSGETTAMPSRQDVAKVPVVVAPREIPKVVLTDGQAALCVVKDGDVMPTIRLPVLDDGAETELSSFYGELLTVVVFWSGSRPMALEQLADLGPDLASPFAERGVNVVGIAVEESTETVKQYLLEAEATFTNLLDSDGAAFALVGSEKLPRTYLLDAEGKILWFDIEYSRGTQRDLKQAIEVILKSHSG